MIDSNNIDKFQKVIHIAKSSLRQECKEYIEYQACIAELIEEIVEENNFDRDDFIDTLYAVMKEIVPIWQELK